MPRKIYVELSHYVRENRTIVVEVPDSFEPRGLDAEALCSTYNDYGGDWTPDYDDNPIHEDACVLDDVPGDDEEVFVSLVEAAETEVLDA